MLTKPENTLSVCWPPLWTQSITKTETLSYIQTLAYNVWCQNRSIVLGGLCTLNCLARTRHQIYCNRLSPDTSYSLLCNLSCLALLKVCFQAHDVWSAQEAFVNVPPSRASRVFRPSSYWQWTSYLSHLLLSLSFGRLSVGVVVSLDQNEVVGLWVDDKFSGGVLQRKSHLVEDGPQLLQGQNSARQIRRREMRRRRWQSQITFNQGAQQISEDRLKFHLWAFISGQF